MVPELSARGERSLRQFFDDLIWRHFVDDMRLEEPGLTQYFSDLLANFVDIKNLYQIRNALGERLGDVGEILIASNPMLSAPSFPRERAVRQQLANHTLFLTALYTEN